MKFTVLALAIASLQPGSRTPLAPFDVAQGRPERSRGTPAETLLAPELLRTIEMASVEGPAISAIQGTDARAGEIAIACDGRCEAAQWAMRRLTQVALPSRTIRLVTTGTPSPNTKAAIFVAESSGKSYRVIRGLWSSAGIADEVVEIFGRHAVAALDARSFEDVGQSQWSSAGIQTTTIAPPADPADLDRASFVAAASAYYLATLPNAGAEALLSHLTVGAHARLAEDGRRAVAMMGNQQRAGADVLIMFGQAIEREQRRMHSFENFMPQPVDPMLHSRILDMEKGITSVWTSMGITSSPFVPAAQRLRGRGGEDKRVPVRASPDPLPMLDTPTAFLTYPDVSAVMAELGNFIDGTRSISDIRDAVSAEFRPLPLPSVVDYFERLAKSGAITLK